MSKLTKKLLRKVILEEIAKIKKTVSEGYGEDWIDDYMDELPDAIKVLKELHQKFKMSLLPNKEDLLEEALEGVNKIYDPQVGSYILYAIMDGGTKISIRGITEVGNTITQRYGTESHMIIEAIFDCEWAVSKMFK